MRHGVVAVWQLDALGATERQVRVRAQRERWHRMHRVVCAIGRRALRGRGRTMTAVLAGGPGAVLSHRSAAALHRIPPHRGKVEVTAPTRRRDRDGVKLHESRTLEGNVTVVDGTPVTTVERTQSDLADVVVPTALQQAPATAERLRLVDRADLVTAPGRRRVVRGEHVFTRSTAERVLHEPFPRRDQKVVLELDFYPTHGTRFTSLRDREKTAWLEEHGFRVLRVDGETLDPVVVRRRLPALLDRGAAR